MVGLALVGVVATTALAQSPGPSPSVAPTPLPSLAPGEIGLVGTVVGHADNLQTEAWQAHTVR